MARGAAGAHVARSSLPEVGGDAVRYVDPLDVARSARRWRALLERRRRRRRRAAAAGRARAAEFSWERTARETLAVVEDRARGGAAAPLGGPGDEPHVAPHERQPRGGAPARAPLGLVRADTIDVPGMTDS